MHKLLVVLDGQVGKASMSTQTLHALILENSKMMVMWGIVAHGRNGACHRCTLSTSRGWTMLLAVSSQALSSLPYLPNEMSAMCPLHCHLLALGT
jgi:hypothetical protein